MPFGDPAKAATHRLLTRLHQCVWHATTFENAKSIFECGEIRADGPSTYPNGFCRENGGISLFDFRICLQKMENNHDWWEFISTSAQRPTLVWLELNAEDLPSFKSGTETLEEWRASKSYRTRIIAPLEAIHRGSIDVAVVRSVLILDEQIQHEFSLQTPADFRGLK